jgi:L-rhamnose mutarotase
MLAMLRETGWRNYSLFLRNDGLLVGYLEPDDFSTSVQAMDERDVNRRWQAEVAGLFSDLVDGRPDLAMEPLEEVFHLP